MTKERVESDRKTVRNEVLSLRMDDEDAWPVTLDEFINLLAETRLSVPEEHRAEILVVPDDDYDSSGSVDFYYDRPETDEEIDKRQAREAKFAKDNVDRERRLYERLKEKFG